MSAAFTHSLLDRLIDEEPDLSVEPTESDEAALSRYRHNLRRDLEHLLNAKRPLLAILDEDPALARTMLGYGLRDISTEDFAAAGARDRIRRMVAQCIREFEPRLTDIDVEVDDAPTSAGIRFRITALLVLGGARDAVVYDASVRPSDRAIAVAVGG